MSDNIMRTPLNPTGAIEMGIWPCKYCDAGWGNYTTKGYQMCQDNCEYIKQYREAQS